MKFTTTGLPMLNIVDGEKVKAVRLGGVMSGADVTLSVVAKPLAARSAVPRTVVFPAASAQIADVILQVPGSLKRGNATITELVTDVAGVKLAVADCTWAPEGLVNAIWKKLAPDRSSVRLKLTAMLAAADDVLMELGLKLRAVMLGAAVSEVDDTVRAVGKPAAMRPGVSRNSVPPALSAIKTYASVQAPAGLKRGKVMGTESVAGLCGGLRLLDDR